MTRIKVCGITCAEDARMLVEIGVDCIGLNFWPESKRYVDVKRAAVIAEEIRSHAGAPEIVGVFVNQSLEIISETDSAVGLDQVQLHGDENAEFIETTSRRCIKALPLSSRGDLARANTFPDCMLLIDSHSAERGGSGIAANWQLASIIAKTRPVWLAGGLRPENVANAIAQVRPYGVDVASGVETSPGSKSRSLLAQFVANVRGSL